MLLLSVLGKIFVLLFACMLAQISLWTNSYVTSRLNSIFHPVVGWAQRFGFESLSETALIKQDYGNQTDSDRREPSSPDNSSSIWNGPYEMIRGRRGPCRCLCKCYQDSGSFTNRVISPDIQDGLVHETANAGTPFWEEEEDPMYVNFVLGMVTKTSDASIAVFNTIWEAIKSALKYICVDNLGMRAWLPWPSNPLVALAVMWTAYAVFLIATRLQHKRQEMKIKTWYKYGRQCRSELDNKFREAFPPSAKRRKVETD